MIEKVKEELLSFKDEKYQVFTSSLIPNVDNILGVRLKELRRIAKKILKNDPFDFLAQNDDEFMELTIIEAMVIGNLKTDFLTLKPLIEKFVLKINNWSTCDTFCSNLKCFNKNKEQGKIFLNKYLNSNKEFELRFGFVILLKYFINDFNYIVEKLKNYNNDSYYSKMAVSWCLAELIIKNYKQSINIDYSKLHPFVVNKGLTKALESYRLNEAQKEKLRQLRNLHKQKNKI